MKSKLFSNGNIAMRDYQESVTIGQTDTHTHTQTNAGQSDPYVPLCFAGDRRHKKYSILSLKCYECLQKQ